MRIPLSLAWLLVLLTFFTAGLLRQFHGGTPHSPYVPPVVGSLLFAGIFFLLLVSAREWRSGAVPGAGIRLGSIVPILLRMHLPSALLTGSHCMPLKALIRSPR